MGDEVPKSLFDLHEWRERARTRYGLFWAHFQSRYLPDGWSTRLHSRGNYGMLDVYNVDPIDIFVGKLFSKREKDLDDLRVLSSSLSRKSIDARLGFSESLASNQVRRCQARENYYIVYGQDWPLGERHPDG